MERTIHRLVKNASDSELEALQQLIASEKAKRKHTETETFTFNFYASNDPRKGKPYVARITGIDTEGKFDRDFYEMEQTYGNKSVLVEGKYTAQNGDIIEIRTGGSWKNDYRNLYIIHDGKEVEIGHITDAHAKSKVKKYLKGKLEATELI